MAVAMAKGKLKGKQPKSSPMQSLELRRMYDTGDYSISDLLDVFKYRSRRSTAPSPGKLARLGLRPKGNPPIMTELNQHCPAAMPSAFAAKAISAPPR